MGTNSIERFTEADKRKPDARNVFSDKQLETLQDLKIKCNDMVASAGSFSNGVITSFQERTLPREKIRELVNQIQRIQRFLNDIKILSRSIDKDYDKQFSLQSRIRSMLRDIEDGEIFSPASIKYPIDLDTKAQNDCQTCIHSCEIVDGEGNYVHRSSSGGNDDECSIWSPTHQECRNCTHFIELPIDREIDEKTEPIYACHATSTYLSIPVMEASDNVDSFENDDIWMELTEPDGWCPLWELAENLKGESKPEDQERFSDLKEKLSNSLYGLSGPISR